MTRRANHPGPALKGGPEGFPCTRYPEPCTRFLSKTANRIEEIEQPPGRRHEAEVPEFLFLRQGRKRRKHDGDLQEDQRVAEVARPGRGLLLSFESDSALSLISFFSTS